MKENTRRRLCQFINSVILAGIMMLATGLYYWVVKAGIPYQEPPLELQIQYAVNMGIGDVLAEKGFRIAVCGGILRLLLRVIWKGKEVQRHE